jgi:hypothetical protein
MMILLPLLASGMTVAGVGTPGDTPSRREVLGPFEANSCKLDPVVADAPAGPPRARLLTDLPNASALKAVFRTVNGCVKPIVVREDIGQRH